MAAAEFNWQTTCNPGVGNDGVYIPYTYNYKSIIGPLLLERSINNCIDMEEGPL